MANLIIETGGKKLNALLSFLAVLEIPFKMPNSSLELDKKIMKARQEKLKGELKEVNPQNVWESIS